jgi:Cu(I)/Ag(I) efflux system membrane fusion protein
MLADVVLRSERGAVRRLAVPGSAVVHTGTRALVFVAREGGRFEPRFVELGEHAGDVIEVRAGLEPGERIVEGANFLLDSESRLRAAIDAMQVGGHKH